MQQAWPDQRSGGTGPPDRTLLTSKVFSMRDDNAGAGHLFGGCGIRDPCPSRGAAGSVGAHLALVLELFQDEPDRLVTDTWHCRPDVCEAERGRCVAQDVFTDALLLGSGGLSCGRAIGENGVAVDDDTGHEAEPGPSASPVTVPAMGGLQERLVVGVRRLGDRLLEAHVTTDGVSMLGEHGVAQ